MSDTAPKTFSDTPPTKRGPGRPKGSTAAKTTAATTNADVKQAMATLDSFYNLIATGLMMTGLHVTMKEWVDGAESLKLSNEDALKAAPKLASWIANAGSTGGATTFILTHGMVLAGVVTTARTELTERRTAAATESQADTAPTDPSYIPGL